MPRFHATAALLPEGFARDVLIEVDALGWITAVQAGVPAAGCERLGGVALPGMINLHSHAFQRAMAGRGERLEPGEASFWSWREVMYAFLARIGPDEQRAIAAQLFVEMLQAGYTSVCEFHYLHNRPDGGRYDDPAAMSRAVLDAAGATGIGLTHLPVLYMAGGFGDRAPEPGQRRFVQGVDAFAELMAVLAKDVAGDPARRVGAAPHSLRAVPEDALARMLAVVDALDGSAPLHIHVAEQVREVRDCLAWCGRRPVARLLDLVPVDARWCLVHATHMDDEEIAALAASGAVAGLCPTTEANLGDGFFELAAFLQAGGRLGIGSDSNVIVDPAEELRLLESGQRLRHLRRAVAADTARPHPGARLFAAALAGGAQACGRPVGALAAGRRADLIVLDSDHPALAATEGDMLLDAFVLASGAHALRHVMVGGRWRIRDGRHRDRARIARDYRKALARLVARA